MDDRDEMGEMDDSKEMGERGDRSEDDGSERSDSGEMTDRGEDEVGDRGDRDELDRAREAILEADEHASGTIHEQLQSLEEGIFEEEAGGHTQDEPGPKVDRIAEVAEKLDALADEAQAHEEQPDLVSQRIRAARDHVRQYLKDHPQGG